MGARAPFKTEGFRTLKTFETLSAFPPLLLQKEQFRKTANQKEFIRRKVYSKIVQFEPSFFASSKTGKDGDILRKREKVDDNKESISVESDE